MKTTRSQYIGAGDVTHVTLLQVRLGIALCSLTGCVAAPQAAWCQNTSEAQRLGQRLQVVQVRDQDDDGSTFAFRPKLGAFFLTSTSGRNGRASRGTPIFEPEVSLSGGFLRSDSTFNSLRLAAGIPLAQNRDISVLPITASLVHVGKRSLSRIRGFGGFGVGMYRVKVDREETDRDDRWLFGGFLTAGADVGNVIFEAKYHIISRYQSDVDGARSSVNVNGFQLTIGGKISL